MRERYKFHIKIPISGLLPLAPPSIFPVCRKGEALCYLLSLRRFIAKYAALLLYFCSSLAYLWRMIWEIIWKSRAFWIRFIFMLRFSYSRSAAGAAPSAAIWYAIAGARLFSLNSLFSLTRYDFRVAMMPKLLCLFQSRALPLLSASLRHRSAAFIFARCHKPLAKMPFLTQRARGALHLWYWSRQRYCLRQFPPTDTSRAFMVFLFIDRRSRLSTRLSGNLLHGTAFFPALIFSSGLFCCKIPLTR